MTDMEESPPLVPNNPTAPSSEPAGEDGLPEHPKGTLAIMLIYGGLFALFWAWIYIGEFLGRGATTQ